MIKIGRALVRVSALSLVSTGVFAQSTVTLYGTMDTYIASQFSSGTGHRIVEGSGFSPNSFGFTGTEDLGDGFKSGFILEGQPILNNGTLGQGGKLFGRQSLIFVSGDFGRVGLGRQQTPARTFGITYAASGWMSGDPFANLEFAMGSAISAGMNSDTVGARLSNSISYSSPTISGFSASIIQSLDNGAPSFSTGNARVSMAGLNYAAGPINVNVVGSYIPPIAGSQIKQMDYGVGATYNAGFAKFLVAYQLKRGYAVNAAAATTGLPGTLGNDQLLGGGVQIPLTPYSIVGLSAAKLRVAGTHRGLRQANIGVPLSSIEDDAMAWSITYTYLLSKRTQLFAVYSRLANDALGTASFTSDMRPVPGGKSEILAVGLRHNF
ncbi:putative porin [Paraburkholderia sp. BL6665CI2N2]|nr:putative porin [Paraburkholderia sp. BL6665CI2N2]